MFNVKTLTFKLLVPVFVISGIVLTALIITFNYYNRTITDNIIHNSVSALIDSLIIGAESDTSIYNLRRLTTALSANNETKHLIILSNHNQHIVAANTISLINKTAHSLPEHLKDYYERKIKNPTPNNNVVQLHYEAEDNQYFFSKDIILPDNSENKLNKYTILLEYQPTAITQLFKKELFATIYIYVAGLLCIVIAFLVISQKNILKPLKHLLNSINEFRKTALPSNIQRHSDDEIGQVIKAYNDLSHSLYSKNEELELAAELANEANEAKAVFLSNMSHELRTPLNSIIGFTKRILRKGDSLSDNQREAIETVNRNGIYLLELINTILDLSKIDANKLEIDIELCKPQKLIQDITEQLQSLAEPKNIEFEINASNIPPIQADTLRIKQIFMNLIGNAIKFSENNNIVINIDRTHFNQAPAIAITVTDYGIGIQEKDIPRLFKRFEQFDEESKANIGKGTGLGLALASEFVKLHNGEITVQSIYGESTTFTVILPVNQKTL